MSYPDDACSPWSLVILKRLQKVAAKGIHPKARSCALKALQRLAQVPLAVPQARGGNAGQVAEDAEGGVTEAERLVGALYQQSDPSAQLAALRDVAEAAKHNPQYVMCAFAVCHSFCSRLAPVILQLT
jgi:hypothetical protein